MQDYRCEPKTYYSANIKSRAVHLPFARVLMFHTTNSSMTEACVGPYTLTRPNHQQSSTNTYHLLPETTSLRGRTPVDRHHKLPHEICPLRPTTRKGHITNTYMPTRDDPPSRGPCISVGPAVTRVWRVLVGPLSDHARVSQRTKQGEMLAPRAVCNRGHSGR